MERSSSRAGLFWSVIVSVVVLDFVTKLIDDGYDGGGRLNKMLIHTVDAEDVLGKRIISTRLQRNVTVREENATTALEVMSRFAANPKWLIYLMPIILTLVAVLFYNIGASKFKSTDTIEREEKLSRLSEVIQMIEENYVDSVDAMKLYESSINSMLKDLDPHSSYIAQEDVAANNEQLQGHFGGVGIRFIILRDTLMVTKRFDHGT